MTEVETDLDSRYDDIDVDCILARCRRQGPITFSRKRCLYQAPEFIKRLPSTEEVEEGSTVTFACKVVGFPVPTVTWFKDDETLSQDARAKTDSEDSGIHSIKIKDVSKCDAGIYKIHASNLEGSSKSMLYISVKARSKRRNKKRTKKTGTVACVPHFPVIIERVAEEQKEMLEFELQPESPLTPLYCTISRKAPVIWPAFLGDWAYNEEEAALQRGEIEEFDVGCEDVFDTEVDDTGTEGLTFVSAAYAQMYDPTKEDNTQSNVSDGLSNVADCDVKEISQNSCTNIKKQQDSFSNSDVSNDVSTDHNLTSRLFNHLITSESNNTVCDILNNNEKDVTPKNESNGWAHLESRDMQFTHQTEVKQMFCDPNKVASISVHRSYAKGDSTSSVARRSPSPFSKSRNLMTCAHGDINDLTDTTTLQNLNNERILHRINQESAFYHMCWCLFRTFATSTKWEDYLAEIVLLICGITFLALCFDLPPTTFIIDILIALFVKLVLSWVFYV